MTGTIFINYRRDDTISIAGRLHDRLAHAFGRKNIFMDVDHIPAGIDFVAHLNSQVATCSVVLVVIGPKWLDATDEAGQRRLHHPDDFVAIEIAAALARDIRVIPVLIDGTTMPRASDLPDSLKPLARRQAFAVRQLHFGRDAEVLIQRLREVLGVGKPSWRGLVLAGAATVTVLLLAGWFGLSWLLAPSSPGTVPSPAATVTRPAQEDEAEQRRLAAVKAEQERQAKAAADEEAKRKADEAEQQRLAAVKAEQERQAKAAADEEAKRKADEAKQQRLDAAKAEQERQARAAADELAKRRAEQAERQRLEDVKADQAAREEVTIRSRSPFQGARIANLTDALAGQLQLQSVAQGVAIVDLESGSVAGNIGFRRGDVIEELNGKRIAKTRELERLSGEPNQFWRVTLLRGGQRLSVVLGDSPSGSPAGKR